MTSYIGVDPSPAHRQRPCASPHHYVIDAAGQAKTHFFIDNQRPRFFALAEPTPDRMINDQTVTMDDDSLDQITDADYYQWLDWGLWGLLALCVAVVIVGGATMAFSGHNRSSRTWGLRMVMAGLVGALAASALSQIVRYFADLITG